MPGLALSMPGLALSTPGLALRIPAAVALPGMGRGAEPIEVADVDGSSVTVDDASGVPLPLPLAPPEAKLGALKERRASKEVDWEGCCCCCCCWGAECSAGAGG
ncbi:hypothetical protein JB92DRAFT_3011824 [Gautieria morchelliformis]|nr:hypothetical protein JB92DRAFT_3011824 [Gautieria morchelliformis]